MAFPKLLQKLFQNNGAGDKLNQDIIPDIPYSKVTDAPSVDSALSDTSENPVQNKVINSALDGKLSTSGGTMTGDIQFSAGDIWFNTQNLGIRGRTNDTYLEICPGPTSIFASKTGASLMMTGRDYTGRIIPKGCFFLTAASEATGHQSLAGYPDGSLTWIGRNVLTGNSAGLTVVAESYSANSWYRKYSDGWIEQGGKTTGSSGVTLTFPLAFSNTNYSFVCNTQGNSTGYGYKRSAWISSRTATTVTLGSDAGDPAVWYACGK